MDKCIFCHEKFGYESLISGGLFAHKRCANHTVELSFITHDSDIVSIQMSLFDPYYGSISRPNAAGFTVVICIGGKFHQNSYISAQKLIRGVSVWDYESNLTFISPETMKEFLDKIEANKAFL